MPCPAVNPMTPARVQRAGPHPESTDNINTKRVGRLGVSDAKEDALVSFMQTLMDGFMPRDQR